MVDQILDIPLNYQHPHMDLRAGQHGMIDNMPVATHDLEHNSME